LTLTFNFLVEAVIPALALIEDGPFPLLPDSCLKLDF